MIVIAKPVGRLANRLLLFAHFIAAAAEHDLVVYNPATAEDAAGIRALVEKKKRGGSGRTRTKAAV